MCMHACIEKRKLVANHKRTQQAEIKLVTSSLFLYLFRLAAKQIEFMNMEIRLGLIIITSHSFTLSLTQFKAPRILYINKFSSSGGCVDGWL